jgi:hypothetical protein
MFRFRESQTVISSYWMTRGDPLLIYQTPVMGAPYTIPFEFPFFQWLTALLSELTPLSITASARTVSFIFFLVCIALVYNLIKILKFPKYLALLFTVLFCLSPLYLYWSATSMIESMALAFALAWLLTYVLFLNSRRPLYLALAIIFGCLAALEKITTFPPALFIGFCLTINYFYQDLKTKKGTIYEFLKRNIVHSCLLLGTVFIPIIMLIIWLHFADAAKAENDLSAKLTSEALRSFTRGSLTQRLNWDNWKTLIFNRIPTHSLGAAWLLILGMGLLFLKQNKALIAVGVCLSAFLVAPLLFWKLHQNHYYYQYSNAIYLIFASSLIFLASFRRQALVSLIGFIIVIYFMNASFESVFGNQMKPSKSGTAKRTLPAAAWVRNNTSPDSALYVFGIDWSSHFHLYAERKGLAVRAGFNYNEVDSLLSNVSKYTGGAKLEAVYVCDKIYESWSDENKEFSRADRLREFLETREEVDRFHTCTLYK